MSKNYDISGYLQNITWPIHHELCKEYSNLLNETGKNLKKMIDEICQHQSALPRDAMVLTGS